MKNKKLIAMLCLVVLLVTCMATPALAAGDVAGAIEGTWNDASDQIKTVVRAILEIASRYETSGWWIIATESSQFIMVSQAGHGTPSNTQRVMVSLLHSAP